MRLTFWVAAVSAIVQTSVGGVFYLYQHRGVSAFFDLHLKRRTDAIVDRVRFMVPNITREQLEQLSGQASQHAMFWGFVLTVFDADGRVLATNRSAGTVQLLPTEQVREVAQAQATVYRRRRADDVLRYDPAAHWARAVIRGFKGDDGNLYVLSAATSDSYAERMIELVSGALIVTVPTGIVVSGLCGWFIAGLALRPLEAARQSASRLTPESITHSIKHPETRGGSSPEQDRLQQALDEARGRMASAFAAQERFMSNVSHELKTPIATLLTEAQTLNTSGISEEVRRFISDTMEEMRRLGLLIDSFLLLTRVREGRTTVHGRIYPINEIIMESVQHCRPMAEQYAVRLNPVLCEEPADLAVRGDPALLRTMIDNLIRNAIRFSPRHRAIDITGAVEGDTAIFRVRDYGSGIPEAIIGRIFDRFVQSPDEVRRGRGHGLGLEIAQGIAELHGGRISAHNRPEGGCEFVISLPRADEPEPSQPDHTITHTPAT